MTTVGMVGGLGPESTVDYYRRILEVWGREDPSTAPSIIIDSLDVQRALRLVESNRPGLTEYLLASVRRLVGAGVDFVVMTANTPHIVFDDIAARSPVPLLSIVEVCAQEARRRGFARLGLLGTRFTMEGPFYPRVLARHGIAVVLPQDTDRVWIHERYVGQLLRGEFLEDTRREFTALIDRLRNEQNIDGIILGGTELPLLLASPVIAGVPVLDTTALHVAAIVRRLRQVDAASQMSLATERLSLRPLHPAHILTLLEEPERFEQVTGLPAVAGLREMFTSEGVSPDWLAALRGSPEYDPWRHGYFLVNLEARGVIGTAGFKGPPDASGRVEIAYGIAPAFEGRGFATEAAAALVAFAFDSPAVELVCAHTLPVPNASTRVLAKCGFHHAGAIVDPDDGPVWRWERRR